MGMRIVSVEESVASVGDGDTIFVHGGTATPTALLAALAARARELAGVTTVVRLGWEGSVARYELEVPVDLPRGMAA